MRTARRDVERHPFEVIPVSYGGLEDMSVSFEIRREDGRLIGDGFARYGWDGEKPVDGWVDDPWNGAAEAVRRALWRMRADGRWLVNLPLWKSMIGERG